MSRYDDVVLPCHDLEADEVVQPVLTGNVRRLGERIVLEVIPALCARIPAGPNSPRRFGFFDLTLSDPRLAQATVWQGSPPFALNAVTRFALVIESLKVTASDLLESTAPVPVTVVLEFDVGSVLHRSQPIAGKLALNNVATKRLYKAMGDAIYDAPLIWPGILCITIWLLTPPFWQWTRCVGVCLLPLFDCRCFSVTSLKFKMMCNWWVPCHCTPEFF